MKLQSQTHPYLTRAWYQNKKNYWWLSEYYTQSYQAERNAIAQRVINQPTNSTFFKAFES